MPQSKERKREYMRRNLASQLVAFQARHLSLDELELWLVAHLQEVIDSGNVELKVYFDRLDGLLIQYGEEVVAASELDEAVEDILRNVNTLVVSTFAPSRSLETKLAVNDRHIEVPFTDLGAIEPYSKPPRSGR